MTYRFRLCVSAAATWLRLDGPVALLHVVKCLPIWVPWILRGGQP